MTKKPTTASPDADADDPLSPSQRRELTRAMKDSRDRTRYVIVSLLDGEPLYYSATQDTWCWKTPESATLFKRRETADLVTKRLRSRGARVVPCRCDLHNRILVSSLSLAWRRGLRLRRRPKFPVLVGKPVLLYGPRCPQCGVLRGAKTNAFAVLSGGAMRVTDRKTKSAEVAEDCIGFLSLVWHGGHQASAGQVEVDVARPAGQVLARIPPPYGKVNVSVEVADWTPGGQFDLYFCTPRCLRAFLNSTIDELEDRMERERLREAKAKAKPRRGRA